MKKVMLMMIWAFMLCRAGEKPEKVLRIVYEVESDSWYKTQAALWRKEIERNSANPQAWLNYYYANRYQKFAELHSESRQARLDSIIGAMERAIPGTYECHYLKAFQYCGRGDGSDLLKAHELAPGRPDHYHLLVDYYRLKGDKDGFDDYYTLWYHSHDLAPWLLNFNYNMLMSVETDGILITNGDNDTFPAEMLQRVKKVRPDVTVLNISLSKIESYLKDKLAEKGISIDLESLNESSQIEGEHSPHLFLKNLCQILTRDHPDIPIHFAVTVFSSSIGDLKDDLYLVGLAFRYSPDRIDNFALLRKNLEQNFRLDYLDQDWYTEKYPGVKLMTNINMNYVAPAVLLARHYKAGGQAEKAAFWHSFAVKLARAAGREQSLAEIEKADL